MILSDLNCPTFGPVCTWDVALVLETVVLPSLQRHTMREAVEKI